MNRQEASQKRSEVHGANINSKYNGQINGRKKSAVDRLTHRNRLIETKQKDRNKVSKNLPISSAVSVRIQNLASKVTAFKLNSNAK